MPAGLLPDDLGGILDGLPIKDVAEGTWCRLVHQGGRSDPSHACSMN